MKYSEYVIIKEEFSDKAIYATFKEVLSESTNPATREITDEQLMEVGSWLSGLGQGLKGLWGATKTAAGDAWNAIKNTPAQLAKAGEEYSTSFKMSKELAKIQDLLRAMDVVEKEVMPKMSGGASEGASPDDFFITLPDDRYDEFERAFKLIKNELKTYLASAQKKQAEFQSQKKDRAGMRYPAASGNQSTRLSGQQARDQARRSAEEARARSAKPGAR